MSINLYILKSSGKLKPFIKQIEKEFYDTIDKISRTIPVSEIDVVVYDNPAGIIQDQGIGGYTPFSYLVMLSIDSNFSNLSNSILKQFKRVLAHELHHALRWKNPGYGKTLIEVLISEGLADHFDMEINKDLSQNWDNVLDKKQLDKIKNLAEKEYFSKNYNHVDWFFGNKKRNIPKWAGYSLGFYLVEKYFKKHPNQKASKLFNIKAEKFVK
jgi:uncharacterized protein YjaZ